jgi:tetratricopeptide (TPR) repeat protein
MSGEGIELLCNQAVRLAEHGGFDEAQVALRKAASVAGEDKRLQGLIQMAFSCLNRLRGDFDEARVHGERALDLLQRFGSAEENAEALSCLGTMECRRGKPILAEGLCRRALKLLSNSQNQRVFVLAHWALGFTLGNLERIGEAHEHLRIALDATGGLLSLREQGSLRSDLALACTEKGDLDEALTLAGQALHAMTLAGERDSVANLHNMIASIHARRCDRKKARDSYERALAILGDDVTPQAAESHYELARLELEDGKPKQAFDQAHTALGLASRLGSAMEEARACLVLGQVLMSLDRPQEAVPYLRRARDVFTEHELEQSKIVAAEVLRRAEGGGL